MVELAAPPAIEPESDAPIAAPRPIVTASPTTSPKEIAVPELRARPSSDPHVPPSKAQRPILEALAAGGVPRWPLNGHQVRVPMRRRGWIAGEGAEIQITELGRTALAIPVAPKVELDNDARRAAYAARDARVAARREAERAALAGEPADDGLPLFEPGAPVPLTEPAAPKLRRRRRAQPRKETVARKTLTRDELNLGAIMYPPVANRDEMRPKTRGDCEAGERPCPWASCKYHLALDINPETGSITLNFPHLEIDEMRETCALDVADRGGVTLEVTGEMVNLTRERVRQIEVRSFHKLKMSEPLRRSGYDGSTPDVETPLGSIIVE